MVEIVAELLRLHPRTMCFPGPRKGGVGLQVPWEAKPEQWFLAVRQVTGGSALDQRVPITEI